MGRGAQSPGSHVLKTQSACISSERTRTKAHKTRPRAFHRNRAHMECDGPQSSRVLDPREGIRLEWCVLPQLSIELHPSWHRARAKGCAVRGNARSIGVKRDLGPVCAELHDVEVSGGRRCGEQIVVRGGGSPCTSLRVGAMENGSTRVAVALVGRRAGRSEIFSRPIVILNPNLEAVCEIALWP